LKEAPAIAPIRGFIFDLDGVLTDTSEFHYRAWQRFCDGERIPFDRSRNEPLRGIHRSAALQLLLEGRTVSDAEFDEMMARKNTYFRECLGDLSPANLLPGAETLLREIRGAGLKSAVGSASRNAPDVVARLGIAPLLDAISHGGLVECSKPAPDLFLHAAHALGLPPAACVVVEDAEAGVEAAHHAGCRAIGLGPRERVGRADVVLPDLAGARLADLLAALEQLPPAQAK
jgi:beta-phosphoglucomutase